MRFFLLFFMLFFSTSSFLSASELVTKKKSLNANARAFSSQTDDVVLSSRGGAYISACNASTQKCTKGKLPKALGKIRKISQAKIVERTAASWLALGEKRSYLCAFGNGTSRVYCASLGKVKMDGVDVSITSNDSKASRATNGKISFRRNADMPDYVLFAHVYGFLDNFKATQARLQTQVDGVGPGRRMELNSTDSSCDDEDWDWEEEEELEIEEPGDSPWPDQSNYSEQEMQVVEIIGKAPIGSSYVPVNWECTFGFPVSSCTYTPPLAEPQLPPPSNTPRWTWCGLFPSFCSMTEERDRALQICADIWDGTQRRCDYDYTQNSADWRKCREDARWEYLRCRDRAPQ